MPEQNIDYKENDNGIRKVSEHSGIEEIAENEKQGWYKENDNGIKKVSDNQAIDQIVADDEAGLYRENDKN